QPARRPVRQADHRRRRPDPPVRDRDHQGPVQAGHRRHPRRRDHPRDRLQPRPHPAVNGTMWWRNPTSGTGTMSCRLNHLTPSGTMSWRVRRRVASMSTAATTDDTDTAGDQEWRQLSRRAARASHRLVGWIYWDPDAIAAYADLGVPDGLGYYIASRGAPLGAAGNEVVTAAFYSIHPDFVAVSLDLCRQHTTFAEAARVRD